MHCLVILSLSLALRILAVPPFRRRIASHSTSLLRYPLSTHNLTMHRSIWLNPLNHSAGQIVFGGVDIDKFIGQMDTFTVQTVLDPVTNLGQYLEPYITLSDMRLISNNGQYESLTKGKMVNVMPDPGEYLSFVPKDYFEALA
jgi:hypothetical protein